MSDKWGFMVVAQTVPILSPVVLWHYHEAMM